MLDAFFVVHDGGFVLFAHASVELTGDPLGALVRHALLEERGVSGAAASYDYDAGGGAAYTLQWTRRSEERLLFVAARPSAHGACPLPCAHRG